MPKDLARSLDPVWELGSQEFLARVNELGPWWFQFEKGGCRFGGEVRRDTDKVQFFFEQMDRAELPCCRVLEFGSHEGSHSLQLAAGPTVREVLGLEAHPSNLARAEFVRQLWGIENVGFYQMNIERFDPGEFGTFDAAFCAGLLYHLPRPWLHVRKMARVAPALFLDTHYTTIAETEKEGYRGCYLDEENTPLSGLSHRSFVFTLTDTFRLLWENGYEIRALRDIPEHGPLPRIYVFAIQDEWSPNTSKGSRPNERSTHTLMWSRTLKMIRRVGFGLLKHLQ